MLTSAKEIRIMQRRHAVSGVLAALILFAMVFTVGVTYFSVVSANGFRVNQAAVSGQSTAHMIGQEQLSLRASLVPSGPYAGRISLSINNTGGVASTITAAFVTLQNGALFVNSGDQKSYFTGTPDLLYSLPVTLGVGESTSLLTGCTGGCSLVFATYSYSSGTKVLLSVLTQDGLVFSTSYPPQLTTQTDVTDITSVYDTVTTQSNLVTTSVTSYVTSDTTTINCYSCTTTAVAGGNILVTAITATPSPVQTGQTVTGQVTVWNFSPYSATGVTVTISNEESGSASVAASGGTCGSSFTIASNSFATCTATYTVDAGGGGGVAVFTAYSVGCIQTGILNTCVTGTTVQSAEGSSNPVQIGNLVSVGPWALDFTYFTYTAVGHTTRSAAAILPSSDTYVALYVNVTNTYSAPLTLLDYSYLQFISPGSDVNEYIVQQSTSGTISPSYSGSSGSFVQYTCADTPPSAPTGGSNNNCLTVQPGKSVVLAFAASTYLTSSWDWGTSDPGGNNVGCDVQIILAYALQSGASYSIFAQDIPFQSVFIQ